MDGTISQETVNEVCELLNQTPPEQGDLIVDQLQREQPALYDYLVSLARPPFSRREHDRIVSIGVALWLIMKHSPRPLAQVTAETLARVGQASAETTLRLAAQGQEERQGHLAMQVLGYPEPAVLACLVIALHRDPHSPFSHENGLWALFYLRIFLDALIASLEPAPEKRRRRRIVPPAAGEGGRA